MDLIFMIGFMGCGKTTWGRKLASAVGYAFIDLDHELERQAGISVAEYFSKFGEDAFRRHESDILRQTVYSENAVISTGGGLPCFFDNMEWINAHGKSIYIELSPQTLAERLEKAKVKRPLLHEKHGDALIAFIADRLAERSAFYQQATFTADGMHLSVGALAGAIKGLSI